MKLSDIVMHLGSYIPYFTDKFSDTFGVATITCVNGVVTVVTTNPHGFTTGQSVITSNYAIQHSVTSITNDGDGNVTVVLPDDHDLTLGWQPTVKISGVTQTDYNGVHPLIDVPNRRTFVFSIDPDVITTITGAAIKFIEYRERGVDGVWTITVVNNNTFTYNTGDINLNFTLIEGQMHKNQRVIGTVTIDRFLEFYKESKKNKFYAVVCMEDSRASKSRNIINDALGQIDSQIDARQLLLEPFSVYIVAPTTEDGVALDTIDAMYEEIRNALFSTLVGHRFPTGLSESDTYSGVCFASHGAYSYEREYYVHRFIFETTKELTIEDSTLSLMNSTNAGTVAFRDAYFKLVNDYDVEVTDDYANLDREALT